MKNVWLPCIAVVLLVACSPDRTLETLIPEASLAVAVVDHPGLVRQALGPGGGDFPWTALDADKPWALAVLPDQPPGLYLAVALSDQGDSWAAVQGWAHSRGGLNAFRLGTYAVLTSPGLPPPAVLGLEQRFLWGRVRAEGDLVSLYVNVRRVVQSGALPPGIAAMVSAVPGLAQNLQGVRLGLGPQDGGLRVRMVTDWVPGAAVARFLQSAGNPSDLGPWSGLIDAASGAGVVVSVPQAWSAAAGGWLGDRRLAQQWERLGPLLGPRWAWAMTPGPGGEWNWTAAVETQDPQAVRQALKTLVASGDVQRHFPAWALDPDTPLIYQDRPTTSGLRTQISLGPTVVHLTYGTDRVVATTGLEDAVLADAWVRAQPRPAAWYSQVPSGALGAFALGGQGPAARGAVRILADGNLELQIWAKAEDLRAWEAKLPGAILSWLSATGGSSPGKP